MKKALLTLALVVVTAASGFAQGTYLFQNLGNAAAAVTYAEGNAGNRTGNVAASSTSGIVAGLFWLNSTTGEFEMLGGHANFQLPGVYAGGQRQTPAPGTYTFEVRAWETAFGATYAEAAANTQTQNGRLAFLGQSAQFDVASGDPTASIPPTSIAASVPGFTVNAAVPEPSTIALGVLGVGALLLLRRRK